MVIIGSRRVPVMSDVIQARAWAQPKGKQASSPHAIPERRAYRWAGTPPPPEAPGEAGVGIEIGWYARPRTLKTVELTHFDSF